MTDRPPCPILHDSEHLTGWEVCPVEHLGEVVATHVVPCGDVRPHQLDQSCWCEPLAGDTIGWWQHNSLDRREDYENGRRLPH